MNNDPTHISRSMVKGRSSGSQPYTAGSEGQSRLLQGDLNMGRMVKII